MRTIFALVQQYDQAKQVVDQLIDKNINKEKINIIAQKSSVENAWDINERSINADVTKLGGQKKVEGLDALLGRQQPVRSSDGDLYVTGEVARMMTNSAANPDQASGLKRALVDFGISESDAEAYAEGIRSGSMLVFVRSDDDQAAEVKNVLSSGGTQLTTFSR